MPRDKPPIQRLRELAPGRQADFFALLVERVKGLTRDRKPYYTCRFRDAHRVVSTVVWADSPLFEVCSAEWKEGQCYKLRAVFGEHERYGPQIEIQNIRPVVDDDRADGFDPAEMVDRSRFDSASMMRELCQIVEEQIADEPLRRLTLGVLERHSPRLERLPASKDRYYPFAGGLLEHTLSVVRTCRMLADRYVAYYEDLKPPLNRDLLLAAAALHELGRVVEFDDEMGTHQSVEGRMFGHLMLGRDLVRDAAREQGDVNPELMRMLEHILVSYLALPEWGSPRLPLIPECILLHHADDLDAKLEMYARCLSRDRGDGPFTERDPGLGKQLFKGRSV